MKSKAGKVLDLLDDEYKFEESFVIEERRKFSDILDKIFDSVLNKYVKDSLINRMTDDLIKKLRKQQTT